MAKKLVCERYPSLAVYDAATNTFPIQFENGVAIVGDPAHLELAKKVPEITEEGDVDQVASDEADPDKPLEDMNITELKAVARELGIEGYSTYKADQKDDLLALIREKLNA